MKKQAKKHFGRPGNKIKHMIELLQSDPFTVDELIERTGLSPITVAMFIGGELKKRGYKLEKVLKVGPHTCYQIKED